MDKIIRNPLFVIIASAICLTAGLIMKSSYLEIAASVMGVINVWLLARQKVTNFIFGGAAVACFAYIYFQTGLIAMAVLSVAQLGFNIYGWYFWIKNQGEEDVTPTTKLSTKGMMIWGAIIIVGTLIWSFFQIKFTDATFPYYDCLIAVMGLVAQYLLSKKILDNWYIWIAMNIMTCIVCAMSGLYVMFILNAINLFICIDGLREWNQDYKSRESANVELA